MSYFLLNVGLTRTRVPTATPEDDRGEKAEPRRYALLTLIRHGVCGRALGDVEEEVFAPPPSHLSAGGRRGRPSYQKNGRARNRQRPLAAIVSLRAIKKAFDALLSFYVK